MNEDLHCILAAVSNKLCPGYSRIVCQFHELSLQSPEIRIYGSTAVASCFLVVLFRLDCS